MKKLSQKEYIGVAVAIVVIGFLLFGTQFWGLFSNNSAVTGVQDTSTTAMDTPSTGIKTEDIIIGTGAAAQTGNTVTVNYIGMLTDGKVFDSSYDRKEPFQFKLGAGKVIRGWDAGLVGMKIGGKRRLVIAPDYGYGSQNVGPIPANSVLIFDVELLNVTQ